MTIGETRERKVTVNLCAKCNHEIGQGDLCSYGCDWDGAAHPVKTVRIFLVIETLLNETLSADHVSVSV